jgi:drug/metabolite transporter (DMT)-like permease
VLWLSIKRSLKQHLSPLRDLQMLKSLTLVVFIGTFGGFWLSLVALKYVDACVATILNSTTPLFVLPLAAISQHERITLKSVAGAIVAVLGVALIVIVSR